MPGFSSLENKKRGTGRRLLIRYTFIRDSDNMDLLSEQLKSTHNYYEQEADDFYKTTVNIDLTELYKPFLELVPQGGKILDAGCGSGRDSLAFKNRGYEVTAFDYSESLAKLASELLGQKVLNMSFEDVEFTNCFDGIWACASLLHVPRNRLNIAFSKLAGALKETGILYAGFKYGTGEVFRKQRLFSCYTNDDLEELTKKCPGFEIKKWWKTEDVREEYKG